MVTVGVMAVLQSSALVEEWSSKMKLYYLASLEEVLDEGEGLDIVDSHDGVKHPLVVSVDIDHGLK